MVNLTHEKEHGNNRSIDTFSHRGCIIGELIIGRFESNLEHCSFGIINNYDTYLNRIVLSTLPAIWDQYPQKKRLN